ncbi:dihydroorotate dehydrogenase electron transfer subunit [Natranaerofaba carboxydovora]|uniref:dihydroorotate dehydrogenase electron transfer subunit n=1 Tax=Natranaerofaba carboxydovora TaxID=2742683 RepID=UPI001F12BE09|nr:dihydroorotate dehydrogenase electron transfer subunit [Natranaerofaba carboxydovora]UMZ73872.1 Dihydroorotate dehydrogenase B (NAD(+)), electron transfer subunit [Natranaerofaba carboxydovora]
MNLLDATVKSNSKINKKIYKLVIHSEVLAGQINPGQFVHIKCTPGMDPLLRRPFSIYDVDQDKKLISICYVIVGEGTKRLAEIGPGEVLSVMGPLGKGFDVVQDKKICVIGGGMGIAPLFYLSTELLRYNNEVIAVLGAKSSDDFIFSDDFSGLNKLKLEYVTEDGSLGHKGLVTDVFEEKIANNLSKSENKDKTIYSCGPMPMLRKVKSIAVNEEIPCQLSLEAKMGCAVGACLGCAVNSSREGSYLKVCKDGPVFYVDEVEL